MELKEVVVCAEVFNPGLNKNVCTKYNMEEIQNSMRENQGKLNQLGKRRAMELQMKSPQLMDSTQLVPSEELFRGRGGGDAGLRRVIGSGKRSKKVVHGGESCDMEQEGGARSMGKAFAAHMGKLHGGAYLKDFRKGMKMDESESESDEEMEPKKMKGGFIKGPLPPMGLQVVHARQTPARMGLPGSGLGGQDVPPGGLPAVAYGSPPQAPSSFKRNTVGMGVLDVANLAGGMKKRGRPAKKVEIEMMVEEPKMMKGGARSMRGAAVSRLMKSKGMTLAEASRYLKAHPEEMK